MFCVASVLILQIISCRTLPADEASSTSRKASVSSDQSPLLLYYSALKDRVVGIDVNGNIQFAKYKGRSIIVDAIVTNVYLMKKNPSIAIENDVVYFALDAALSIPGHSEFRTIQLIFDQYAIYNPKPFVKGEKWRFTLTEDGALIFLEPG